MNLRAVADQPLRAIALVRVSKVGDRGDDLISPELQTQAITTYAASRGARVVEWVEALDESASASKSPWWARLDNAVSRVEAGEADLILVWKLSRAARHRRRWAVALDRVEVAGGSLESATEGFDVSTSTGKLSRGILAELAAWESDVKSEQWKEAHARRYRMGLPHTRYRTWGYQWDGSGYVPDPEVESLIVRLYADYANGAGFQALANGLNARGVRTLHGRVWTATVLSRWMDRGMAAGFIATPAGPVRGAHPPIIDQAAWDAYLATRAKMRTVPAKLRRPKHHLSGLVYCAHCLRPMHSYPYVNPSGATVVAFRCATKARYQSCPGVYVVARVVDVAVKEFLRPLAAPGEESAAAAAAARAVTARHDDELLILTRELDALKLRGARMLERLDAGIVTETDYVTWREERDVQQATLEKAVKAAKAERALWAQPSAKETARLYADYDRLTEAPAALAAVLASYVKRAVVHPAGVVPRVNVVARWDDST